MAVDAKDILYMLADEFKLTRETTEQRLKLQKTIYLLQIYGLKLGYGFSWYKYGPYSQDLVQDAYRVLHAEKGPYKTKTQSLRFNKASKQKFDRFRHICGDALKNPGELELVASVDFVRTTWYLRMSVDEFIPKFRKYKSRLFDTTPITDDRIKRAFRVSQKLRQSAQN